MLNGFAYGLSKKIVVGYREKCCKKRKPQEELASPSLIPNEVSMRSSEFPIASLAGETA